MTSKKLAEIIEELKVSLIETAKDVNTFAKLRDKDDNLMSYGEITGYKKALRKLGCDVQVWGFATGTENVFTMGIESVVIDGEETTFGRWDLEA